MEEQFTAIQEVYNEVKTFGRLERIVQFDDEGVLDALQDHSFDCRMEKVTI